MVNLEILNQAIGKGKEVFIADTARVIGNINLGNEVSIWFGAVLRGDADKISIGDRSNIQDNATIHVDPGFPVEIGEECIIGHGAVVHGAKISNNVLIGIHATVLNGAQIGSYSIIAAGALVTEGMIVPPNSLVVGVPGKVIRTIGNDQMEKIKKNSESYVNLSKVYLEKFSN
jgi:carbonic anhydrase/acetyltransferase-like protein (isoleucine patch superfamily)